MDFAFKNLFIYLAVILAAFLVYDFIFQRSKRRQASDADESAVPDLVVNAWILLIICLSILAVMQFSIRLSLVLMLALLLTGVTWLIDSLLFKKDRLAKEPPKREPLIVEYSRSFFPIILIVFVLRSFVFEPFRIPSGSMLPTLEVGDFILVKKYAYGIRLPVFGTKLIETGEPQRGDVVVFRYPEDPSLDYIKRIIGLPGDRIEYRNKQVIINGQELEYRNDGSYIVYDRRKGRMASIPKREEVVGEVSHEILLYPGVSQYYKCLEDRDGSYEVPDGHYFVMGDNRDDSNDSRGWCAVPDNYLVGKAFMIWMHWDGRENRVKWERIGDTIE